MEDDDTTTSSVKHSDMRSFWFENVLQYANWLYTYIDVSVRISNTHVWFIQWLSNLWNIVCFYISLANVVRIRCK